MDKKSKVLLWMFVVLIVVSIFLTYKRAFLSRDFTIFDANTEEQGI